MNSNTSPSESFITKTQIYKWPLRKRNIVENWPSSTWNLLFYAAKWKMWSKKSLLAAKPSLKVLVSVVISRISLCLQVLKLLQVANMYTVLCKKHLELSNCESELSADWTADLGLAVSRLKALKVFFLKEFDFHKNKVFKIVSRSACFNFHQW